MRYLFCVIFFSFMLNVSALYSCDLERFEERYSLDAIVPYCTDEVLC
jgi:hypothetical protein